MMVMTLRRLSQYSTFETVDKYALSRHRVQGPSRQSYLAVGSNCDNVDSNQNNPEDEAESPPGKVGRPVLQDQLQGNQVRCSRHGVVKPVVPSQSKPESVVDKAPTWNSG